MINKTLEKDLSCQLAFLLIVDNNFLSIGCPLEDMSVRVSGSRLTSESCLSYQYYRNGRGYFMKNILSCRLQHVFNVSTFELRSRIAFWLDSLEQRKRLERIERSNSKMQLTKYSSIKCSKDSKKINDRSGALWETVNRDAERDDATGHTPRSGRVGSKYRQKNRGEYFEKRCEAFCFYDAL